MDRLRGGWIETILEARDDTVGSWFAKMEMWKKWISSVMTEFGRSKTEKTSHKIKPGFVALVTSPNSKYR